MSKQKIVIDIGSNSIKIVTGRYIKEKLYIKDLISVKTPEEVIQDGNILDRDRLAFYLKNKLDIYGIKSNNLSFTTNSTAIIYRDVFVPITEEGDLDTMVSYELQQYLPIAIENYVVQYRAIGNELVENGEEKQRVLAVVYPKYIIEGYLKLAQTIGFKPEALDINFNSIAKLLENTSLINSKQVNKEKNFAFIDLGAENCIIHIISKGKMEFTRIISTGAIEVDKEISRIFNLNREKSEKKKIEYSILKGKNEEVQRIEEIINIYLNSVSESINRILIYYKNKTVGNKIDKIYIFGGAAGIKSIEKHLEEKLSIPVEKIEAMDVIAFDKGTKEEQLELYLNAIGALIRL